MNCHPNQNAGSTKYWCGLHLVFHSIILVLLISCYHSTLDWMYGRYIGEDSYYSHGFIIPFVSAYLIWHGRERLKREYVKFSWFGLALIVISALIHISGTVLYIFSISGLSLFILIIGITLFLLGWELTRRIIFPLVFLIFMFPLPSAIINSISFPIKMVVTKVAVKLVGIIGIPVFREGFYISIPEGVLLVGNPCSGVRSLIAFLALGAIISHLMHLKKIAKIIVFLSAIPIAIIANLLRVLILIVISHYFGLEYAAPESFWHGASGIFMFIIGLSTIFYLGNLLEWAKSETDI